MKCVEKICDDMLTPSSCEITRAYDRNVNSLNDKVYEDENDEELTFMEESAELADNTGGRLTLASSHVAFGWHILYVGSVTGDGCSSCTRTGGGAGEPSTSRASASSRSTVSASAARSSRFAACTEFLVPGFFTCACPLPRLSFGMS